MSESGAVRPKGPSRLKTYSHLAGARRMPTEYELSTSDLLWYPAFGDFEVEVPLGLWYRQHQRESPLQCDDWERFVDPRETIYATYTARERAQEESVDSLMRLIEDRRYDASLPDEWLRTLERVLPVVRYPAHALQMLAAYVGQMAPGGRLVVVCAFQAADEVRRIQRVVERTVQLRRTRPGFGENARTLWERESAWQPMREVLERALVAWDWGEAFAALSLCIAPLFDELLMTHLPELARRRGDPMLTPLLGSLGEDCEWHRDWAKELVATATGAHGGASESAAAERSRQALASWIAKWLPPARDAVRALDVLFAPDSLAAAAVDAHDTWIATLGL
jgi:toluene monooxygenase system protein E